ncbi:Hypothetical protein GLP15_2288 [Giardia lamblia P15]|uniref:Uncharacterized protein n=1 Tax=Giardia intestinalis (strain P15) TaxID=658858 RepID=E1F2W9_GIAIA|nr:Hypothetical protein GLP15_2288 [Giardia lamblia P15]
MLIPCLVDLERIPELCLWHTKNRVTLVPCSSSMEINDCKQFVGFIAHSDNMLYFINQANIDPIYQKDFVMSMGALANFKALGLIIRLYFYDTLHPLDLLFESDDDHALTLELLENYRSREDT